MFEYYVICHVVPFRAGLQDTFKRKLQQEREPDNMDLRVQKGCQSGDAQGRMGVGQRQFLCSDVCQSGTNAGGFHNWNWLLLPSEGSCAFIQFLFFSQAIIRRCARVQFAISRLKLMWSPNIPQTSGSPTARRQWEKTRFHLEWVEISAGQG